MVGEERAPEVTDGADAAGGGGGSEMQAQQLPSKEVDREGGESGSRDGDGGGARPGEGEGVDENAGRKSPGAGAGVETMTRRGSRRPSRLLLSRGSSRVSNGSQPGEETATDEEKEKEKEKERERAHREALGSPVSVQPIILEPLVRITRDAKSSARARLLSVRLLRALLRHQAHATELDRLETSMLEVYALHLKEPSGDPVTHEYCAFAVADLAMKPQVSLNNIQDHHTQLDRPTSQSPRIHLLTLLPHCPPSTAGVRCGWA